MAVIATALLGLAGIAAAFFAPWSVQTRLERRTEKRTFRGAQRLVLYEMRKNWTSLSALAETLKEGHSPGWLDLNETLWDDLWVEHCGTLAMALDDATWMPIEDAYGQVISLLGYVNAVERLLEDEDEHDQDLEESRADMLEMAQGARDLFATARKALERATPVVD